MKVLFTDFDGVLKSVASIVFHNRRRILGIEHKDSLTQFDPIACSNLEYILEETDAFIVVSSDWRKDHTIEQIQTMFEEYQIMPSRVIDTTPELKELEVSSDGKNTDRDRGKIIEIYLKNHPEITDFVIIDDDSDLEPYLDRLVQTDSRNGLTFADAERVIEMLEVRNEK